MANFSLSTPQQQSNLENTKRNVLTNRCKNISFRKGSDLGLLR